MNWFRRFMMGRYGADQLSLALLIFSVILTFLGSILHLPALTFIGYVPLVAAIYRMLSRNVNRRSMENYKYSMLISPAYAWFNKMRRRVADRKTYKYVVCRNCKAELRLPRGKGKIVVTCPKCGTEFTTKT